jgi:hypothetical protein
MRLWSCLLGCISPGAYIDAGDLGKLEMGRDDGSTSEGQLPRATFLRWACSTAAVRSVPASS